MQDHRQIDLRSLAFGRAIAAHLQKRPELISVAKDNLRRWLTTCSAGTRSTLLEWQQIIDGPVEGVIALLTDTGERATRLRQSNPFAGVLSNQERNAILLAFDHNDKIST